MRCRILLMMPLLLSACAVFQPSARPDDSRPIPVSGNPCRDLLGAYAAFALLDARARERMLKQVGERWSRSPRRRDRLNLVMLLAQPTASARERRQARKLLDDVLASEKPLEPRTRQLAVLLRDQLRRTHAERLKALELRRRLKARLAASRRLSARLDSLRSQLRQLKTIERNLNEKERSIITPSAPGLPDESP